MQVAHVEYYLIDTFAGVLTDGTIIQHPALKQCSHPYVVLLAQSGTAQEQDSLPVNIPQVAIEGRNAATCPSAAVTEQAINSTKEEIHSILRDTVVPILDPPCRIPHLLMFCNLLYVVKHLRI